MNYHLEISIISRRKGYSVTSSISYITGQKLRDCYKNKTYNYSRHDVVWKDILAPNNVPPEFRDYQYLCNEIDRAEVRWDARTARQFIGSLPNELSPREQIRIVNDFVEQNFVANDLCAIAAIHRGHNKKIQRKTILMSTLLFQLEPLVRMDSTRKKIVNTTRKCISTSGANSGLMYRIGLMSVETWT